MSTQTATQTAVYNPYTENGYNNRKHYLKCLSENYGVPYSTVTTLAEILGATEDFDGLLCMLDDAVNMFGKE